MKTSLTDFEWSVLSALWKQPNQTISGIIKTTNGYSDWKYNTFVIYIKRMCEKNLIAFEQLGRDKFYYPLVAQKDCIMAESESMLKRIDGKVAKEFLVCMIKGSGLSEQDCEELKALLDDLNKEGE